MLIEKTTSLNKGKSKKTLVGQKISKKLKEWYNTAEGFKYKKELGQRFSEMNINNLGLRHRNSERAKSRIKTNEEKKKIGKATIERFKDPIIRKKHQEGIKRTNTIEKRQKISKKLTGHKQSEKTKTKRSETYKKKWQDLKYREKTLKIWKSPNKDTKIERLVKEELIKRNITFIQNKIFPEFHTIPDFYLPDRKMMIYCDGEYWHSPIERQIVDNKQVEVLRENNYIVFRLKGKDILENVSNCLDNIGLGKTKRLKIVIGIPTATDYFHRKFAMSLMSLKYPPHSDVDINVVVGAQLPFARNRIVQHALDSNSDYVFFIDADMIFQSDLLIRLFERNLPMVNALAFRRIAPHYPTIFKWDETNKYYETVSYTSGLKEVDATGMAAHLIKTEVFRKMNKPWYYYRDNIFSSDLTFCENAKKAGFKIMIDTDIKIGHLGSEEVITEEYYINHLSPSEKEKWNANMKDELSKVRANEKENFN